VAESVVYNDDKGIVVEIFPEEEYLGNQEYFEKKIAELNKTLPVYKRLEKVKLTCFTLQGSTPKEQRARLVREFNAGKAQVFLISLKAGGTGLNLTAADVVIHYDPWWNLAAQNQATDRAHRIGQRESVQVYKLIVKDSIEEKILDLQAKKAELMNAVSDASDESILTMSKEDLMALLE
jgi:SNF2 family DNA or RNA helicase